MKTDFRRVLKVNLVEQEDLERLEMVCTPFQYIFSNFCPILPSFHPFLSIWS